MNHKSRRFTLCELFICIAIIGLLSALTGCSTTAQQKALSAVTTFEGTAAKLQAEEQTAAPLVAAVTGSNQKVSNDLAYAETITADAQTLAPLLSGLISLVPTSTTTASAYPGHYWTKSGMVALRRYRISPNDRFAVQKLYHAMRTAQILDSMHYKNGREAKNGDKVILIPSYGAPVTGILYDAVAGNDQCNGRIARTSSNDLAPICGKSFTLTM